MQKVSASFVRDFSGIGVIVLQNERSRIDAVREPFELERPFDRRVAQGRNADATGQLPSMAALTRAGAMNAIEIVMLTWRRLYFWRAAICSIIAVPETLSSSQARPRAIDLSSAARRSNLIGRTRCRWIADGNRISLNRLAGGLVHGISRQGACSMATG